MVPGKNLHAIREQLGLSQEELAEKLGVSRNTVSRWERGSIKPSIANLAALNRLLAELEEPPAPPPEEPAPQTQEAQPEQKPAHRRRGFWAMCVLAASVLVVAIAVCVGFYLTNAKLDRLLPEDNLTPMEDLMDEKVDISQIESVTRQPLQP